MANFISIQLTGKGAKRVDITLITLAKCQLVAIGQEHCKSIHRLGVRMKHWFGLRMDENEIFIFTFIWFMAFDPADSLWFIDLRRRRRRRKNKNMRISLVLECWCEFMGILTAETSTHWTFQCFHRNKFYFWLIHFPSILSTCFNWFGKCIRLKRQVRIIRICNQTDKHSPKWFQMYAAWGATLAILTNPPPSWSSFWTAILANE